MNEKEPIKPDQAKIIAELEKKINKSLPRMDRILYITVGVQVEGENVIGLGLYESGLTALPESFGNLESLRYLYLSGNELTALPKSFGQLKSLRELLLSSNKLTALPNSFGQLKSLQKLDLQNNQLTALLESFGQLISLRELNLEYNQLTTFPEPILELKSLQKLNLGANEIKTLPESLGVLKTLQELYLYNNQLTALPESFGQLISLQELLLWSNKLTALPISFGNLESLQYLYLSDNELTAFPESFGNLKSLKALSSSDNQLIALPESFYHLKNLKTLDLTNNSWKGEWKEIETYEAAAVLDFIRERARISVFIIHLIDDQKNYPIIKLMNDLKKREEIHNVYTSGAQNIPQSQLVLFLCTNNSVKSKSCHHELTLALDHEKHIIPVKGLDIDWSELKQIDLREENRGYLDLYREKGVVFKLKNFDEFCDELYNYIWDYKRKNNLFETREEKIETLREQSKEIIEDFIESEKFKRKLKNNLSQVQKIMGDLSDNKISINEFIRRSRQILLEKS